MDHVDDAARWVEWGASRKGDGQITGVCPEPCAGQSGHLHLIFRQLRLGDTLGGPHDDPPLYRAMESGDRAEQLWLGG